MSKQKVRVWTIPNILTFARMLAVPFVVYFLHIGKIQESYFGAALIIFILAALTDQIDGYLSRKLNQQTTLGEILDPLADKIIVMAVLIELTFLHIIPAWIVILILSRDIFINGLRAFAQKHGLSILPNQTGKIKVYFQGFALGFLIICTHSQWSNLGGVFLGKFGMGIQTHTLGLVLLYISLILSFKSALDYSGQLYRHLRV